MRILKGLLNIKKGYVVVHVLHTKVKKYMKILVTGANGYLGQGIVKEILNSGHDVIAVDFKTNNIDDRAKKLNAIYLRLKIHMNF